jgi:hypothetical protein
MGGGGSAVAMPKQREERMGEGHGPTLGGGEVGGPVERGAWGLLSRGTSSRSDVLQWEEGG